MRKNSYIYISIFLLSLMLLIIILFDINYKAPKQMTLIPQSSQGIESLSVKNTNKGNDDNFHNGVPFDINKPVYCSCGEKLKFNYSGTRSDDMYTRCNRCGKTYHIHSEPVYRKVIE